MELRNTDLKNLLKVYEGKTILIVCKNTYKYKAADLKVLQQHISFTDKFGKPVLISMEEIASIQEVENG